MISWPDGTHDYRKQSGYNDNLNGEIPDEHVVGR